MKTCQHCNQSVEDSVSFCPYCGQKQEPLEPSAPEHTNEKEKAFYIFRRNLRHERKCWSIVGKVWVGICIFFAALALLLLTVAVAAEEPALLAMSMAYFIYPLIFLPITIINLVMAKKITAYLENLESDPNSAVDRCGGVWLIVLGALFNEISLIFIIMNFVHVKTNKALLIK